MNTHSFQITVSQSIGTVSAEIISGNEIKTVLTLAHGAGAGMNHSFMVSLANSLAEEGIATIRFNFPYMEQKKMRVDVPAIAHKTVEVVLNKTHELFPAAQIFVSGKSFGGRMSSQYLSNHTPAFVNGIIFYGFPLHPAGKPAVDRAEHLKNIKLPMVFLQGTRDELAKWPLIEQVTKDLPTATLFKIEGADHSFKTGKHNTMEQLVKATKNWIAIQK